MQWLLLKDRGSERRRVVDVGRRRIGGGRGEKGLSGASTWKIEMGEIIDSSFMKLVVVCGC